MARHDGKVEAVLVMGDGGWMGVRVHPSEIESLDSAALSYIDGNDVCIKQSDYVRLFRMVRELKNDR